MTKRHRAVIKLYKAGKPMADITAKFGISTSTIYHVLDEAGIPRRYVGGGKGGHAFASACKAFLRAVLARTVLRDGKRWRM